MARGQIHYEVFFRRTPRSDWRLDSASENRAQSLAIAEAALKDGRAVAVRVTKEVLDDETREYQSYVILAKGELEPAKAEVQPARTEPACLSPADLYTARAREKIGRLLEDWLRRRNVTPFELLHRPDLAESLDASGMELQHAIQKLAVAESQGPGAPPLHDLIRGYQKLTEQVVQRLMTAGRKKQFPDLDRETLEAAARRLPEGPDRAFLLAGGVAAALADTGDTSTKLALLLDFAQALPIEPQLRTLCRAAVEQPLAEILSSRSGIAGLLGPELDCGGALLALTRLVAPREVEALTRADPTIAALTPTLEGQAARLAELLASEEFAQLRRALGRRVLAELTGPRRLRPSDPEGEIAVLRALAMVLTASAGVVLSLDEVQAAFLDRSAGLVASDFVTGLTQGRPNVVEEVQALVRLAENVTGAMNRNRAAEWLISHLDSLRFEKECRTGGVEGVVPRLSALAALDRSVRRIRLRECDERQICERLGALGAMVEGDARFCALVGRSPMPLPQKANLLLRLAGGDLRLAGPTAERARVELARLFAAPEARSQLVAMPEVMERLRALMAA